MDSCMRDFPIKENRLGQDMARLVNMARLVRPSRIDKLGYFPVVGQVVAFGRAVYGVAMVIASLVIAVFSEYEVFKQTGKLTAAEGLNHIGRAVVEAVPVIGGLCTYTYDQMRMREFLNRALNLTSE